MEFRLGEDGNPEGEVDYPTLSCGGVYIYQGIEGDVQVFKENLTYGAQSDGGICIDDGIVRIRVITENATNTLIWEWYSPDTGVLSSTAELLRE